jgi:hypothetical protein
MQNEGKLSSDGNFCFAQPASLRKPDVGFVTLLSLSAVICGHKCPSITLRLASGTDRGNGAATRNGQGRHGRLAQCLSAFRDLSEDNWN